MRLVRLSTGKVRVFLKPESNLLFETRMRHRLTQHALADRLGVAKNYVYLIESGRKPLTKAISQKLAELDSHAPVKPSSTPSSNLCRYPEGCDVEAELGEVKERLAAMEHQLGTVIRLLGASLHLSDAAADPGRPARKVG